MALVDVVVHTREDSLPQEIHKFLSEADRRIEDFTEAARNHPIPAFVPSDFTAAYWALSAIDEFSLSAGSLFCEWGSGFGVVTCLAAWREFESYGIEIEPQLVTEADALAQDFDLPTEFVVGNFVPSGAETLAVTPGEVAWLATEGADAYEDLGMSVDDFDVIYAYPWPGEDDVLGHLFNRYAAEGALLVTYNGVEDLRVRRKVGRKRSRR